MSDYIMTIGLEVHAELSTKSKMFCGCANLPADERELPNTRICPICMGHPGTLPVINKEAVKKVLLIGTAIEADIADFTEFDRKNYFYPDIPKGYQISQYKYPLVQGGILEGIKLTRIHLEEDTAKSSHEGGDYSLVDFNRAGVPLMELVTEPVMHTAEEATNFAKELQLLLQHLGVSNANMEAGQMRVEANISVSKNDMLGTKVEVKNINSFRAVGKAIEFEYKRQVELLERGGKVEQETRGWDENKQQTFSQRLKESAHDYRYFPDPDLPKLIISEIPEFSSVELKKSLTELPWQKRARYAKDFGIKKEDIEVYVNNRQAGEFFEEVVKNLKSVNATMLASNYITSDLIGLCGNQTPTKLNVENRAFNIFTGKVTVENFTKLIQMISKNELSSRGGKDILKVMFEDGGEPEKIAKEKGLTQKNDIEEIKKIMEKIIRDNPKVVTEYKKGKLSTLQFLVGQGMKETKGSANPEILKQVITELLKK